MGIFWTLIKFAFRVVAVTCTYIVAMLAAIGLATVVKEMKEPFATEPKK